jgi:hypothetical protein
MFENGCGYLDRVVFCPLLKHSSSVHLWDIAALRASCCRPAFRLFVTTAVGTQQPFPGSIGVGHQRAVIDPLRTLHPAHRHMALGRRLVQPVFHGRLTWLTPPTPFGRRYTHTELAIRCTRKRTHRPQRLFTPGGSGRKPACIPAALNLDSA